MDNPEIDRHDKADQGYREQQALDDVETERLHAIILLSNANSLQAMHWSVGWPTPSATLSRET
jgi:hypothetical protein